jgi:hypothetical protein
MRRFLILFITLLLAISLESQSVKLNWDQNTNNAAGYFVYQGLESKIYTSRIDASQTNSFTVSNVPLFKTNFFVVSAYNLAGLESDFSNEVITNITLLTNKTMRITGIPPQIRFFAYPSLDNILEATTNFTDWVAVSTTRVSSPIEVLYVASDYTNYGARFFRVNYKSNQIP